MFVWEGDVLEEERSGERGFLVLYFVLLEGFC